MGGSALPGGGGGPAPQGPLYVKIEVVWKVGFFVLKRSVFEPRSQRSNRKKDPNLSDWKIFQKLPKIGHMAQMFIFRQFSDYFSVRWPRIFFSIAALKPWFEYASFEYKEAYFPDNLNFDL